MGNPIQQALKGYHVGWQDDTTEAKPPSIEDALKGYHPGWENDAATPVAVGAPVAEPAPGPPATAVAPAASPFRSPAAARGVLPEPPRFDRFGEPVNEAARDVELAQSAGGPPSPEGPSTAERRDAFLGALGKNAAATAALGATGPAGILAGALQLVDVPGSPLEQSFPTSRGAPPIAGYGGERYAVTPPAGTGNGGPSDIAAVQMARGILNRDPAAIGSLAGMAAGGAAAGEVYRGRPGTALEPGVSHGPAGEHAFRVLGLDPRNAITPDDVEAAYRERAKATHPDVPAADRVARGGPADPVEAAFAFNQAAAAKEAALQALGRGRPVQARRPAPTPPEAPVVPQEPVGPVQATPEPVAPVEQPPATPAPASTAVAVPANVDEARALESEQRDLSLRAPADFTPEVRARLQAIGQALNVYRAANPIPEREGPGQPEPESLEQPTIDEFLRRDTGGGERVPMEPPAPPAQLPLETASSRTARPVTPQVPTSASAETPLTPPRAARRVMKGKAPEPSFPNPLEPGIVAKVAKGPVSRETLPLAHETIGFEAPADDPQGAEKEALAAQVAGTGSRYAAIHDMRVNGATDVQIAAHLATAEPPVGADKVPLAREMFRIPLPGGEPTTDVPAKVEREASAVTPEPGAPHDDAAIQEGMFGEKTLAGKEQTEMMSESAGVPTAKLKSTKIGAEEIGRVKRGGAEPAGERPMALPWSGPVEEMPQGEETQPEAGEDPMHFVLNNLLKKADRKGGVPLTRRQIQVAVDAGYANPNGKLTREGLSATTTLRREEHERQMREGDAADAAAEAAAPPKPKRTLKPRQHAEAVESSNPKYAKMSNDELEARWLELADRMSRASVDAGQGVQPWTRKIGSSGGDSGTEGVVSGTAVSGKAGRAIGRLKQDGRIMADVEAELKARGVDVAAVHERAEERAGMVGGEKPKAPAEEPDFEELAKGQKAPYGPKLRNAMLDALEKAGADRAELEGLSAIDLANRALEGNVLDIKQEADLLEAILPTMGGILRGGGLSTEDVSAGEAERRARKLPTRGLLDELRRQFAPAGRTVEAALTARTIRKESGQLARRGEVVAKALKAVRKSVPMLDTAAGIKAATVAETGGTVDQKYGPAIKLFRELLDGRRAEIQALGTGKLEHFIEDYLPHIWEDPQAAAAAFAKRPIQGSKAFLKERKIGTIAEGMALGLKPVSNNLADMVAIKLREMDKYIMSQRVIQALKRDGLVKFERGKPPAGWERINDNLFTVYAPRTEQGATAIRGYYYGPEPVARILNNYLSPGLRGNPLFDAYMGLGNMLNSVQLGLSAFHAMFITTDAMISRVALGVGQLRTGRPLQAIGSLLTAPAAPIANLISGVRLGRAYRAPGSAGVEMERFANAIADAGGRIRMDPRYVASTVAELKAAAKAGNIPKALAHTLGLALRAVSWPIMEWFVPAMKRGVFYDLVRSDLEGAGHGKIVNRMQVWLKPDKVLAIIQRDWDSVDNRMGQVVYDDLFWDHTMRDLMHATVRAVGWDMGSVREIAGGVGDVLTGKPSIRTDYVIGLVLTTGLLGALVQYLYTGEAPKDAQDVFAPRTGEIDENGDARRVQLPTYMKDVGSFRRHPLQTIAGKLHPLLHVLADFITNRDYAGNMVRNPHDPAQVQLKQAADYLRDQFTPISIGRMQQGGDAGSLFGITPAPRDVERTPAENAMAEMLRERMGALTPEQKEQGAARRLVRQGKTPPPGVLTPEQMRSAAHTAGEDPRLEKFRHLSPEQRQQVYDIANEEERSLFAPYVAARPRGGTRSYRP